jgi:hypothetical protein
MRAKSGFFVTIVIVTICQAGFAGLVSASVKGIREIAEQLAEQAGKKGSKEFVEKTSTQLGEIASKCGRESLDLIDEKGLVVFRVIRNAGDDAPCVVKAIRNYGDDAIRVAQTPAGRAVLREGKDAAIKAVARHGDAAIPLIQKYGDDCARALAELSPANGRRLIQLVDEGILPTGHIQQLMPVMSRGDAAMDFIWRHRKVLVPGTVLAAFVLDPEPYIVGLKDLADILIAKPMEKMGDTIAKSVNWNLWIGVIITMAGTWFLFKHRGQFRKTKDGKGVSS